MNIRGLFSAALGYVKDNPDEVVRAVINATGLRFGIPLAALRWAALQATPGKRTPKDIEIGSSPPALRLSATVDAMGTPVRASAAIKIDEVDFSGEALRVAVRTRAGDHEQEAAHARRYTSRNHCLALEPVHLRAQ